MGSETIPRASECCEPCCKEAMMQISKTFGSQIRPGRAGYPAEPSNKELAEQVVWDEETMCQVRLVVKNRIGSKRLRRQEEKRTPGFSDAENLSDSGSAVTKCIICIHAAHSKG